MVRALTELAALSAPFFGVWGAWLLLPLTPTFAAVMFQLCYRTLYGCWYPPERRHLSGR